MIIQKATTKICILRSLKFNLDRRTLQTLYFSFIRPIVEYADIIWDNCPQYYKDRLESINIEAGRIITGATKLVSLTCLYKECGWETLNERRIKHKLILFYKILNGLTPDYLQTLIPPQHFQRHDYNTRHSSNYVHINCRTTHHLHSYIPSVIRLWNDLPENLKNISNIQKFKKELSSLDNKSTVPDYYHIGPRQAQILHARLRMNCSALRHHLYLKNIEPSPYCSCYGIETTAHFLFHCKNYTNSSASFKCSILL